MYKKHSITTTLGVVVMLLLFFSCGGKKTDMAEAITERDSLPSMTSYDVVSFITDSGITRYKIEAEEWLVYDKKNPSYQAFEKGAYLEQYAPDTLFNVEFSVKTDTAYFYDKKELWVLIGNVEIMNLQGDRFETELLYWDQKGQKVYTDRFIRIIQPDRIIMGYGFESDDRLEEPVITNVTGEFDVDEAQTQRPSPPAMEEQTDSIN